MTAPATANPAASGRIVPARKFHNDARMLAVANCEPSLKPFIMFTVVETVSRKMAAMIDPSGFRPPAPSSAAFSTMKAAKTGTSLASNTSVTKLLNVASRFAIHRLLTDPDGTCAGVPCAANQASSCGKVKRIADHRIQRWNWPPASKFIPPSRRSARPARTMVHRAAGAEMSNSSCRRSRRICGAAMTRFLLLDSGLAALNPELNQAREARDQQQSGGGNGPARRAASVRVAHDGHPNRQRGPDGRDHITYPVDGI